jgi:hypothetical protein
MKGTQQRLQCPKCGKAFFAWRPAELPGAPVKCYLCGTQFEDEAAKRKPVAAQTTPTPEAPTASVAPTPAPTPEAPPPAGVAPPAAPAAPPAPAEDAAKPS